MPGFRLIGLMVAACLALVMSSSVQAASCTASATPLAFGTYNPLSATPKDSSGTITVTCSDFLLALLLSYDINLSTGMSGSYAPRKLGNGAYQMNYNLYTSALRLNVWGDGSGGTSDVSSVVLLSIGGTSQNHTVHGRIPAGQLVGSGTYTDAIIVTVEF